MKFYELDLRQVIPYGIPLNTDSHVEYTSHINDFFLQGFENYFGQLFKVENNELVIDYSRSCAAPNSLFACEFCSDSQLEDAITHAGFKYYTTNDHDVNAKFVYDLNNIPFGTEGWLTAVARYAANSRDIIAKPVYEGKDPYHYGIYLSGDITSSANTSTILSRMIENLGVVGTAHTQVDEFSIEDTSSQIEASAAVGAIDVGIFCEVEIPVVDAPDASTPNEIELYLGLWYSNNAWKNVSFSANNYWVGGITEQTDVERLSKFGITTTTSGNGIGPIGAPVYDGTLFDWSVSSLCDADKKDNEIDVSTFSVGVFSSRYTSVLIRSSVDVAQSSYYWRCRIKLKDGYTFAGTGAIKHPLSSGGSANWSVQLGEDYASYSGNGYFTVKHSNGTYRTYSDKFTNGLGKLAISEYSEYIICQVIIEDSNAPDAGTPSDDPRKPLMFLSLEDGSTVKLSNHNTYDNTYEISYDGETWSAYAFESVITLNEGEKVYFRCTYYTPTNDDSRYVQFVMSGKIEAYNNVNSMYSTDFANITTLTQQWCYYNLFDGCSALYRAPLLPATSLSTACYAGMFSGCSNLVEPPALPALTLATDCYASMFLGCAALTKAPDLPAINLATYCYYRMFRFCAHLAEIRCAAVNPPSGESAFVEACNDWLDGAAASGTFYADASATWTTDVSGIPSGWTRVSFAT